jgi:hypothetical protein
MAMGKHDRRNPRRVGSRLALLGGTAIASGAIALTGAGTASATSHHWFGPDHHLQRNEEHRLGILHDPRSAPAAAATARAAKSTSHSVTATASVAHAAKSTISAEHNVGKTSSAAH